MCLHWSNCYILCWWLFLTRELYWDKSQYTIRSSIDLVFCSMRQRERLMVFQTHDWPGLKPRTLGLPCEHSTVELPRHLVISPTTFHLKPNPVTCMKVVLLKEVLTFRIIKSVFYDEIITRGCGQKPPHFNLFHQ